MRLEFIFGRNLGPLQEFVSLFSPTQQKNESPRSIIPTSNLLRVKNIPRYFDLATRNSAGTPRLYNPTTPSHLTTRLFLTCSKIRLGIERYYITPHYCIETNFQTTPKSIISTLSALEKGPYISIRVIWCNFFPRAKKRFQTESENTSTHTSLHFKYPYHYFERWIHIFLTLPYHTLYSISTVSIQNPLNPQTQQYQALLGNYSSPHIITFLSSYKSCPVYLGRCLAGSLISNHPNLLSHHLSLFLRPIPTYIYNCLGVYRNKKKRKTPQKTSSFVSTAFYYLIPGFYYIFLVIHIFKTVITTQLTSHYLLNSFEIVLGRHVYLSRLLPVYRCIGSERMSTEDKKGFYKEINTPPGISQKTYKDKLMEYQLI
ncbi:hypothetical protein EYC80_001817 [Monilinia laxa]|uniref:Uncharacterized protein n=1 Tax=Monilinia laxa TaxID=61186 RepID=A0A5N6K634_MONLA|nr:hypothetical protein EYC80_001817 [Monilinia laxa]